ncbi:hypothetical protein Pla175_15300 [Pirellulimonas nuda]|uniref:Uncharacterized protein n=1 Tax=Pirellulimonas nuda TaxID=2528009 RepID=A0A518D9J7_9BACT|nr:hypothetical protein [Pirellulimonas nuda]QDU88159.1 hypothetical protein Pla175_15300 [Pirellulimonas nuda]
MRYRLVWLVVVLPLLAISVSLAYQNRELRQEVKRLSQPTPLTFAWPMGPITLDDYSVEKAMKIDEIQMQRRF